MKNPQISELDNDFNEALWFVARLMSPKFLEAPPELCTNENVCRCQFFLRSLLHPKKRANLLQFSLSCRLCTTNMPRASEKGKGGKEN